ncbi:uncharacterized protein METZ01_LOCUS491613, partial [marine metagenome]
MDIFHWIVFFAGISILDPSFGFLPILALCFLILNVPNPLISTFCCFDNALAISSRT